MNSRNSLWNPSSHAPAQIKNSKQIVKYSKKVLNFFHDEHIQVVYINDKFRGEIPIVPCEKKIKLVL